MYKLVFYGINHEIKDVWYEMQKGNILTRLCANEREFKVTRTNVKTIGNITFYEYVNGYNAEITVL